MSAAIAAYRTRDEDKLDTYASWQDELREHHARIRIWRDTVDPEGKLTLRARRGFIPVYFEGENAPAGWRRNKNGSIVPDKRLKAGMSSLRQLRRAI